MNWFDWLFGWKPEKNKWYKFFDRALSNKEPNYSFLTNEEDRLKIKPFAYLKGKNIEQDFS